MFSSFTNGYSDISQNESLSRRCNNNLRKKCISLGMSTSAAIIIIAKQTTSLRRPEKYEYDVWNAFYNIFTWKWHLAFSYSVLRPQNLLMGFRQVVCKSLCNEPICSCNPRSFHRTSIRVFILIQSLSAATN